MRRICAPVLCLLLSVVTLWGAGSNEEYVRIYTQMQQAETLESSGRKSEALADYLTAHKDLLRFKIAEPTWNPEVVEFRLNYLKNKIEQLRPLAGVPSSEGQPQSGEPTAAGETTPAQLTQEVMELKNELGRMRSENASLQSKLKEALAVRPAALDPDELAKAEERNRDLSKEVELLKVNLQDAEAQAKAAGNPKAVAKLRQELDQAKDALDQESRRADKLAGERTALESRLTALMASQNASHALRAENALLKQQLAEAKVAQTASTNDHSEARLAQARAQLALLRNETDILRLEKAALERRMQQSSATPPGSPAQVSGAHEQMAALEQERDTLKSELSEAHRELAARSIVTVGEPTVATAEVNQLKARLAVYEAQEIPYSIEERALFRLSRAESGKAVSPDAKPPASAGKLVAEAEQHFQKGEFRQAERVFREVLKADTTNAFTLANLAATQMEQGEESEAETNLRKALAVAPKDPFALTMFGYLNFRQKHLDEALDYLSLAAQYKPDNATIQNYLGVVLGEKGMRGPAESALRRAIKLQPGFSQAHYNLALIYIMQNPPVTELARWHYQKALEGGHPRNTEIEQMLDHRSGE